jgi:hypothetical protein
MRRMPLCEKHPWPGEPVIVAVREETARSHVVSPLSLPFHVSTKFSTLISEVGATENSGSGVFDAGNKCLLGVISRKLSVRPNGGDAKSEEKHIAKYFVLSASSLPPGTYGTGIAFTNVSNGHGSATKTPVASSSDRPNRG